MRISDWSSDVCSSNMEISQLRAQTFKGLDCQRRGKRRSALGGEIRIAAEKIEHRVAARRCGRENEARKELRIRRLPGLIQGRNLERFRSEEHTSELQSLMRISYAVFCLKKK